jgi:hypothetical protein
VGAFVGVGVGCAVGAFVVGLDVAIVGNAELVGLAMVGTVLAGEALVGGIVTGATNVGKVVVIDSVSRFAFDETTGVAVVVGLGGLVSIGEGTFPVGAWGAAKAGFSDGSVSTPAIKSKLVGWVDGPVGA